MRDKFYCMKKYFLLLSIFVNIWYICSAQGIKRNRAEAIQQTYFVNQLKLSPEETQKFWPIFNSYKEEIRKSRLERKDDELAFEEKVLGIRKKYKPEFKAVLGSDQRVNQVFIAEKSFRELLRKELQNRRRDQPPIQGNKRT